MDEGLILLLVGIVLSASVVAALGAARTGLPVLVAFLGIGMLLGSDGPGGISFDDAELTQRIGTVGLGLILYEGGLQTSWRRLREVVVPAALLSTVGVFVTALIAGFGAHALFSLSWLESFLLGAVIASTDAAAVFATLRTTQIRRRLARTLEAESGGNDPMAIALTVGLIAWIEHEPGTYGAADLALEVVRQIGIGLVAGVVLGALATWVFARIPATVGSFAPVASLAAAAISFGAADVLGGSGFLAVYLVGLAVGSTPSRYRRQLVAFHEGLAFAAQVALFVVLGLLVFPGDLPHVALPGLALALLLMVVARPAAVWLSTALQQLQPARADPPRLGRPARRGADRARDLRALLARPAPRDDLQRRVLRRPRLDAVQGTTLERVAGGSAPHPAAVGRRAAAPNRGRERRRARRLRRRRRPRVNGSAVRELGLPRDALVAVIARGRPPSRRAAARSSRKATGSSCSSPRKKRADLEDVFARWRRRV